ncbi:uncharacterized protein PV09_00713 [Verruconis gallopava]|uniref:ABC transporter domain-containing protein n=1 Tax=Verruconis gallopava TaxID=253628 RepID=A0A0D1Y116_9PEZI|nr:uncharacterized protein PV09_00713 [Verruconis gallopava]KIW08776.1 hypothetical protein PV09_00713 [Verruconis gallopava]
MEEIQVTKSSAEAVGAERENSSSIHDSEKGTVDYLGLENTSIHSYSWSHVDVEVKDRKTKEPLKLLENVSGYVAAGEMMAIMGPSGSGKTTLLNVLAHREATANAVVSKKLYINGAEPKLDTFRKISAYVEQEEALLGALTVKETIDFAARLSIPRTVTKTDRIAKVKALIKSFGLTGQTDTIIGTPVQKGLSGGQKKRVGIATQLVTSPKLLFLDEPTSGLDATAGYEVMSFVKSLAKKYNLIVIASIHQPSTAIFELFDKLLLLSRGRTTYNGPVGSIQEYFASIGHEMPHYINPAEFLLSLVNTDFAKDTEIAEKRLLEIQTAWEAAPLAARVNSKIEKHIGTMDYAEDAHVGPNPITIPLTLIHRNLIKSYRDVIAYTIRIVMYLALGIMMGTVWLRLSPEQQHIQSWINAIFFGGAFMSFMAVAYIPAFIEDLHAFRKERLNGLYGPTSFMIANFITGAPYLFLMSMLFSVVAYFLSNFHMDGTSFMRWVLFLFLDLMAAEGLVVLVSSIAPIFVVALAVTAFANGLWMCVNGFMVQVQTINVFYRYVFHYIDYQAYVFQLMMVNEFQHRTYKCQKLANGDNYCMYPPTTSGGDEIAGIEVLNAFGYPTGRIGKWIGLLCVIVVGYRILGLVVLWLKRH